MQRMEVIILPMVMCLQIKVTFMILQRQHLRA